MNFTKPGKPLPDSQMFGRHGALSKVAANSDSNARSRQGSTGHRWFRLGGLFGIDLGFQPVLTSAFPPCLMAEVARDLLQRNSGFAGGRKGTPAEWGSSYPS